jgi:mannose/cellobiose epimerase-like protein (N-acyl-D-glucosamine 2-epimerase family)
VQFSLLATAPKRTEWTKLRGTAVFLLNYFKVHKASQRSLFADSGVNRDQRSASASNDRSLCAARNSIERILTQNIIPFWYPGIIDTNDGGYRLNHDLEGTWRGPANKCLVTQARTLWFFSRLINSNYRTREYLAAATHGYEFLRDRLLDREFGGFYWEVGAPGDAVKRTEKQMYGQAFALYALTEYALASGDPAAKVMATELFNLMETKGHDNKHGGYQDILQRDWSPVSKRAITGTGYGLGIKRMNTHLHLLEAMTTFVVLTDEPRARQRLVELIFVNSNSVVRKNIGACTDKYLENWQPLHGRAYDRVSYGHDLENIWLLEEACRVVGISGSLLMDLYRTLFNYALQYGFDRKNGGFYDSGCFNAPADRREKIWWVQAEGLIASLQMLRLTGEPLYWDSFTLVLDWIVKHQVDWKNGDWYEIVDDEERASGVKAGPWKGPYHNGRAMLRCLDLLDLCSVLEESRSL